MTDAELLSQIRQTIEQSPFVGEGHRKVWARLRRAGVLTSRKRVLRLMREAGLLAPTPQVRKRGAPARRHDHRRGARLAVGHRRHRRMKSTDGRCAVFVMVDHASGEVWYDAVACMDRWAAADLLREVTTERFGSVEAAVAAGLVLRYDGGSCFSLGALPDRDRPPRHQRQPGVPYQPETNGCAEKAIQILKEQVLWIEPFETLEQLRTAVRAFGHRYNADWLIERHGFRTPIEAHDHLIRQAAMA